MYKEIYDLDEIAEQEELYRKILGIENFDNSGGQSFQYQDYIKDTGSFNLSKNYHALQDSIIKKSFIYIDKSTKWKNRTRTWLAIFICFLVTAEYVLMTVLCCCLKFEMITIISIFSGLIIETFGLIAIMLKYVFNSGAEEAVIRSIENVSNNYKKLN